MRIKAALIILILFGIGLAASLLIRDSMMSPAQVDKVTAACPQCHSQVPVYASASYLHDRKAAFSCSRCHADAGALRATDSMHRGLQQLGAGAMLFAVTGIIINSLVINRRGKAGHGTT